MKTANYRRGSLHFCALELHHKYGCDVRARDIRIWQINFATFLRWQKIEKLIFKYERIALTKLYVVCWFVSFSTGLTVKKWWCKVSVLYVSYPTQTNQKQLKKANVPYPRSLCSHTTCFKIDTASKFKKSRYIKNDNTWFSVTEIWRFLQGRF